MANRIVKVKVKIDSEKLRKIFREKSSIRKADKPGVCSEKTIRVGLKTGLLTVDTVAYLAHHLEVAPESFADIDGYFVELRHYINHWEEP